MSGGTIRLWLVWVVFGIVVFMDCAGNVFGCEVTEVDLFLASTSEDIHSPGSRVTALVIDVDADNFWAYVDWDAYDYDGMAGGPDENPFYVWLYNGGSFIDSTTVDDDEEWESYFHVLKSSDPGVFTLGKHTIKAKAQRKDSGPWVWDTGDGDDPVVLYLAKVDVCDVPPFLFASATYATPIKFDIKGFGSTVELNQVSVTLNINGETYVWDYSLGQRFTGGSTINRENGEHHQYTAYVPHTMYDTVSIGNIHRTKDANYVISISCREAGSGGSYLSLSSKASDNDANVTFFADDSLLALDLPVETGVLNAYEVSKNFSDSPQAPVQLGRSGKYEHWQRGSGTSLDWPSTYHFCTTTYWSYPHTEPTGATAEPIVGGVYYGNVGAYNILDTSVGDEHSQTATVSSTYMTAYTRLYDDADLLDHNVDVGLKNMMGALRRGGNFCVSYGGKALASGILNSGEYAMDLAKTSGRFNWNLFDNCTCEVTNICTSSSLNLAGAGAAICGGVAVWAVFTPYSVPLVTIFGTASAVLAVVSSYTPTTGAGVTNTAEGGIYAYLVLDQYPYDGVSPNHVTENISPTPDKEYNNGGPFTIGPTSVEKASHDCDTGDVYTFFVEIESGSSIVTRDTLSREVKNETTFRCTGANAASDFAGWSAKIWRP